MSSEKPLSQRAFSIESGFGQKAVQKLFSSPGFPVVAGKVFWSDFVIWRRLSLRRQHSDTAPSEPLDAGRIPCESTPTSGLPFALPPRAARLAALAR